MKNSYIIILIILFSACSNKEHASSASHECPKVSGHIVFVHAGEEDKPVRPFSIATHGDKTIYNHKKRALEKEKEGERVSELEWRLSLPLGDDSSRIERVDSYTYKQIKDRLISFAKSDSTKNTYEFMSAFDCYIIDDSDTLTFTILKGNNSQLLYLDLFILAMSDKLNKAKNFFEHQLRFTYTEYPNAQVDKYDIIDVKYIAPDQKVGVSISPFNFEKYYAKSIKSKSIIDKVEIDSLVRLINRLPRNMDDPYSLTNCEMVLHLKAYNYTYSNIYVGKYHTNIFHRSYINTVEFVDYLNKVIYDSP